MRVFSGKQWIFAAAFSAAAGAFTAAAEQPGAIALRLSNDETTVSAFAGDRPLLQYRYRENPCKPYVQKFFSPRGANVLRDSPHDHKHHHALMFAVGVDGVDFWSENDACGRQKHRELGAVKSTIRDGRATGSFTQQIDWVAAGSDKPLLVEQRTIEVSPAGEMPASVLTWKSQLKPGVEGKSVTLDGRHYFGLGIRFVESMDRVGRFFNSSGEPGKVVRGEERLTPAKWCAYTAPVDGKPVTVAVFDHPDNPRHPATMFTMPRHFAYLAATLNLKQAPLPIEPGSPLELIYGVAVWDGEVDAAEVERFYRDWIGLAAGE